MKRLLSGIFVSCLLLVQLLGAVPARAATTVAITSPTASSTVNGTSFTVTGTATASRKITVSVNGVVAGTTTSDGSGAWSLQVTNQTAGAKTITATASVQYVYATNAGDATVSVYNAATNQKVGSNIGSGGANQTNMAMRPDGAQMVTIAGFGGNAVKVWNLANQAAPVISNNITAPDTNTIGVSYSPDGSEFWVTSFDGVGGFHVRAYSSADPTSFTDVTGYTGFAPAGFGFKNDGSRVYVSDCADNAIHVIDTATMAQISTFAGVCGGLGIGPNNTGYILDTGTSSVYPVDINAGSIGSAIVVGGGPTGLAFNSDGSKLYTTSPNGGANGFVSEVTTATNTVTNTFNIGGSPRFTVFNSDFSQAYTSDSVAGNVTARNGATFASLTAMTAGDQTTGLTITPLESATASISFTITTETLADTGQNTYTLMTLAFILVIPSVYFLRRQYR